MRNLKKFLALVLAMVMAMSLMVTANAATKSGKFPDENIDPDLVEAVDVLAGLEVFKGQNTSGTEDGTVTFAPKSDITRKEVAALIYRVFSTDVKDTKIHLYKDYANFSDVNSESWYAGYVGLCANHNIIKGSNNGRFYPDNKVTGYEVLAMILRVVGYDEEGEFTGSGWQTRVASMATKLHITDNLNKTNYAGTLNQPATREVVAELIFQTMVRVPQVTHNSLGYNDKTTLGGSQFNPNLGWEKFGLWHDQAWSSIDKWGNPGYKWHTYNGPHDMETPYNTLTGPQLTENSKDVATIKAEATAYYNKANVRECDVSHDLGIEVQATFVLYVNSKAPVTEDYKIVATDTVTRVGGQGRETNFYYDISSPFAGDLDPTVTMVDTFLAKVTRVTPVVLDHNNHVVQMARADLEVFDRADAVGQAGHDNLDQSVAANRDNPQNFFNEDGTRCTNLTTGNYSSDHFVESKTNYTYAVGDYVLVRGYTDPTQAYDNTQDSDYDPDGITVPADKNKNTGLNHSFKDMGQAAVEKMAFETNMLKSNDSNAASANYSAIEIVKATPAVLGKQTSITWNDGTHMVGGETKNDQLTLFMDYAGRTLNTTFAWYYDQFGNLIGIGPVANSVNYGVITKLYSAFKQGSSSTTGDAVAMASVTYADGTKAEVAISKFFVSGTPGTGTKGHPAMTSGQYGADMTYAANSLRLFPVYDYNAAANLVMTSLEDTTYVDGSDNALASGELYVAPVAEINKNADKLDQTTNTTAANNYFGIIGQNMFKFITTEDGVVTAVEVAGGKPAPTNANTENGNDLFYRGHYHLRSATATAVTTAIGAGTPVNKLSKSQGNITVAGMTAGTGAGQYGNSLNAIWLDSSVKIILNTDGTLRTFNGLSELPSDITIKAETEIDWADTNGDLRADYVYLYGETTGTITYGLFYYNGGAASWNGTEGTLVGWLNGEQTTLKFTDEDEFKTVQNSQAYAAHLFAVRMMDGVVEDVMLEDDNSSANAVTNVPQLLYVDTAAYPNGANTNNTTLDTFETKIIHTSGDATKNFKTGAAYGNPYGADTMAGYFLETNGTAITYSRNINQVYGTVSTTGGGDFYVGANTKIYGIGMGATHGEAVLEYLQRSDKNDVTIIYDKNTKGILEIYVATDPNITPSDTTATYNAGGTFSFNDAGTQLLVDKLTLWRNGVAVAMDTASAHSLTVEVTIERLDGGTYAPFGTYSKTFTGTTGVAGGKLPASSYIDVAVGANTLGNSYRVSGTMTGTYTIGGITYDIGTVTLPTRYITQ